MNRAPHSPLPLWATSLFAILTSLAAGPVVESAEKPPRQARAIAAPPRTSDELVAVPLDSAVYSDLSPNAADLRVLNAADVEVAFILQRADVIETRMIRKRWESRPPTLRPVNGGELELTVRLEQHDPIPTGLRLVTPLVNFEQRVVLQTSDDGEHWTPLGDGLIFDYTRHMDVRNDEVMFSRAAQRQLRIAVEALTAEQALQLLELTRRLQGGAEADHTERLLVERRPFRIDRIELFRDDAAIRHVEPREQTYAVEALEATEAPEEKTTVVTFTMHREPLRSLTVESRDRNFSRRARVEVLDLHGTQERWRTIATGTLTRFDVGALQREELTLRFPATRAAQWRIVIENRDSPPLAITGVAARGEVQEVVFLASPGESYRLAYGGKAAAPHYDTAAIEALLQTGAVRVAGELTGPPTALGELPAGESIWKRWLNNPGLQLALIALLVLLLGWGLYQAAQRVESLPAEHDRDDSTPGTG